ncbi:hypothetical protein ASG51_22515 [Methylobacterium sp. Leaf465]|uniref:hypothetical protein n=1 Tax=Methylobacterium sp. Leaf465 TaxID=1736385 RepID=UPI0006FAE672|nr:hypothetical protein [Methylobacterium sp. Leaf465]KQT77277.1 hypothetical protein ASG51_22515 [Methylobacterium sp. Leaf465]
MASGGVTAPKSRPFLTLNQLPLFADDRDVARAVVGPDQEKIRHWLASVPSLEMSGLPKRHTVYGRYVPAVRLFYERQYGIGPAALTQSARDEILAKLDNQPPPKRKGRRLD